MDRLSPVGPLALITLLGACSGETKTEKPTQPAPSRVDAVVAAPKKAVSTEGFCDSNPKKPFAMPPLDGAAPAAATTWRWVNVWATWCGPCVEEMPRVAGWEAKLNAEGTPMDLEFLSVDATADDVTKFRSAHPDAPQGSRLQNLDQLSPWLASIGLDDNAVLPLQLFVNPAGELACVRMGAVSDDDYEIVKAVLNGR